MKLKKHAKNVLEAMPSDLNKNELSHGTVANKTQIPEVRTSVNEHCKKRISNYRLNLWNLDPRAQKNTMLKKVSN